MSLIGDALRKARQEAAEREVERRGVLYSARISDSPRRSNLGLGLALGAAIAVAATIAGGTTAWWLLHRTDPAVLVESAVGGGPITGQKPRGETPPSEPTSLEPTEEESVSASAATTEAMPTPVLDVLGEDFPENSRTEPDSETAPLPSPSTERQHPTTETAGFAGMEDGEEIYILEAELGATVLSLDFIIFRADDPFVEINGIELHTGGVVEGFRVKSIERDRVRLSDGRRNIVLRTP